MGWGGEKVNGTGGGVNKKKRKKKKQKKKKKKKSQKKPAGAPGVEERRGGVLKNVQNLEDMVAVALVDSDLAQAEGDIIISFCGLIGIQQEQLDLTTSDVSKRLRSATATISCAKCNAQVQAGARFCPACGTAIQNVEPPRTALEFEIPKSGYALTFSESTATGFASALELAKELGPVQTVLKNKKTWYLVAIPGEKFLDVVGMAKALSGIRNRAIYQDGVQKDWDEVFGFVWCANQRDHAFKPVEYCFGKDENRINPWGCKQARMEWTEWSNWFSLGHWERSGLWVFDKERIRHNLATNLHRFRFCPYLNQELVEAVVVSIPEKVEVSDDGPWKYNAIYEETPGSIKVVQREGDGDVSYTREYYVDGVRPRGLRPLEEILTKALKISETNPGISPRDLLTK